MSQLFQPIKLGPVEAKNRVFMAPMTRARATKDHVPTPMMIEYYGQRSSAGLIISEAIGISQEGLGVPFAPGIWSEEQVEHWKPVTENVHKKGGKIVAQLWHMGRATHSNVTGMQPVSSSETTYPREVYTYAGKLKPELARAVTHEDIQRILKDYANAAKNAITAGFDGVQIHGANGYLVDQFLKDSTNFRTDNYGGSIENRVRFMEEVISSVVDAVGSERTSIRLSPNGDTQGCYDSDSKSLFEHAAQVLEKYNLMFVELREPGPKDTFGWSTEDPKLHGLFRKYYTGILGLNQEYTLEEANKALESGIADFISFGRSYISNPDLVERLKSNSPLTKDDMATWYIPGEAGYIDYPVSAVSTVSA